MVTHPDVEGIDTYGKEHHNTVSHLMSLMLQLHKSKSETYKSSWIRRGFVGAFHTYARPWDRIENMVEGGMELVNITFFAACVDLALYLIKMAAVIVQKDNVVLEEWIAEEHLSDVYVGTDIDNGIVVSVREPANVK